MKPDDKPVEFVVRALSPNENDVVGCLVYSEGETVDLYKKDALNAIEVMLHAVRFGLVEVNGLEGWEDAKRGRINGSAVEGWTEETIAAIDSETRLFLGRAILSMSRLDQKKTGDLATGKRAKVEQAIKNKNGQARHQTV